MNTPQHWEADVVLNDGDIVTLRPVRPEDREELQNFYARVSDKSKYLRFFAAHPVLTEEDLKNWMDVDHHDRVTLVMVDREDIVATAKYALIPGETRTADVSFLVQDDHHHKGVANILLEHLAQIGRECSIETFFAEMLTQNRTMVQTFIKAGYQVNPELEDGFITVNFPIDPTETSREVMARRELRAEANSIRRLLQPTSVAVIGDVDRMQSVVPNLTQARFQGELRILTGTTDYEKIPENTDLVIVEHDPDTFEAALKNAAEKNAFGVVALAGSKNPGVALEDARTFVDKARDYGLRALGPAAVGLINTHTQLNASPAPMPRAGTVGLFTQSAGIATLTLSYALKRGCGLSSFIGAGSFGDVTGNDVIQYWADDDATNICLLSLDTIGNPRKFFRVLSRLAMEKRVVVFIPSRALKSARHYDHSNLETASTTALDEVIRNTGAMVVTRRETMFDIAQLLARQPVPRGKRITVISNSAGLTAQMAQSAQRFSLEATAITVLEAPVSGILEATQKALAESDVVLSGIVEIGEQLFEAAYEGLKELAATTETTPLISTFVGFRALEEDRRGVEKRGQLPVFSTYADAIEAVSLILTSEEQRAAARPTPTDEFGQGDKAAATQLVQRILAESSEGRWASDEESAELLRTYGIDLVPWTPVTTLDEAITAAESYGWNVVLKNIHSAVRGRPELSAVMRHITTPSALEDAWHTLETMATDLGIGADMVVQPTVKPGTTLTIRAIEDPVLGPMVSLGVAGPPSELLGDTAWRVPPLRRTDARAMIKQLRAAPLLMGYRGSRPTPLSEIEHLIMQVARLKDDIAAIVDVELTPAIASSDGTTVVGARIRLAPLAIERDPLARSL
ncbi:GNAT family N-acetyltransferase [Corynebacterium sp. H128]|uniref:GNAT family N-acetyltransferase n=1 Tax=Corynebacterium sp. H128 TaxID=3133427 RepID=UPI0030A77287